MKDDKKNKLTKTESEVLADKIKYYLVLDKDLTWIRKELNLMSHEMDAILIEYRLLQYKY